MMDDGNGQWAMQYKEGCTKNHISGRQETGLLEITSEGTTLPSKTDKNPTELLCVTLFSKDSIVSTWNKRDSLNVEPFASCNDC